MKLGNREIKENKEVLKELTSDPKSTQEQKDLLIRAKESKDFINKKK